MKTILRAIEPEDLDFIYAAENNQNLWIYGAEKAPISRRDLETYLYTYDRNPLQSGQLRMIVADAATSTPVGLVDLYDIDALNRNAMIGVMILPDYQAKGYSKEAILLLQEYCRKVLQLRVLGASVSAYNQRSIALFESAGFNLSGVLKNWLFNDGTPTDECIFTFNL